MMAETFEPKIVAFLCNWCSYAGADMAGISRIQYRPNIRVIRVMCSGRVNPVFILEAFLYGSDGVLVLGCHPGDCHYLVGNYQAEKLMNRVKKLMEVAEISPQRLYLDWVSAAEGVRFAQIVNSFIEKIRQEGSLGKDARLVQRLKAAKMTVEKERVRWLMGNERNLTENGDVFGEKMAYPEFDTLADETIREEFFKSWLLLNLDGRPTSAKELATVLGLQVQEVFQHLVDLMEEGEVSIHSFEERTPRYIRTK
jgi:coenzyme F420-reducing hydrogenase delta subunit